MKKVVVTGPTGSVGVALLTMLIKNNIEVYAVCRKGSKRLSNIPRNDFIHIVECNLDSLADLCNLIPSGIDTFYHLGWDGTFGNSRNNMHGQLKNIQYTLDAVEAAEKLGCSTFVGTGSQAEYGRVEGILNAKTPTFPENGYGIAKLCAGQMTRVLCEEKGIRHIWTRILSIYGPFDGENTMIMSTIRKLMNGEKPSLTKGEQEWDYLYSLDAGNALYLLGENGIHGKTYCIGSGKTRQLVDYVKVMREKISPEAELGIGEIPYGAKQVMHLCADIDDLQKDTGFIPTYEFEEGIQETIDWYKGRM